VPWASKAQQRWGHATGQPFADSWDQKTEKAGGFGKLPARVKQPAQSRKPKGGGGGQFAGYVGSPLLRNVR